MKIHPLIMSLAVTAAAVTAPVSAQTAPAPGPDRNSRVAVPSEMSPDNIRRCLAGIVLSYRPGSHRIEGTNNYRDVNCRTVIRVTGDDNLRTVGEVASRARVVQQYSDATHTSGIYKIGYRIDSDQPQVVTSMILQDRATETTNDILMVSSTTEGTDLIESYADFSPRYMNDPRKGPFIMQGLQTAGQTPGVTMNINRNPDGGVRATFNSGIFLLLQPIQGQQFTALVEGHQAVLERNYQRRNRF